MCLIPVPAFTPTAWSETFREVRLLAAALQFEASAILQSSALGTSWDEYLALKLTAANCVSSSAVHLLQSAVFETFDHGWFRQF